jgi:hypothetical protein
MLPRRPAQLFRSRWSALFWAAGVIFTAITFVGVGPSRHDAAREKSAAPPDDAESPPISNADVGALKQFIDQH